jgi:hypothetical protein
MVRRHSRPTHVRSQTIVASLAPEDRRDVHLVRCTQKTGYVPSVPRFPGSSWFALIHDSISTDKILLVDDFSDSSEARKEQNFLDDLSNSGPAVRLYCEGGANARPEDHSLQKKEKS